MSDWIKKLFVEHSDFFLKLLNERWSRTEELVNGMVKVLSNYGINSGNLLDLCCGNGRIAVHMAKKGFKAVGVDISKVFLEDAKRKAEKHHVSDMVTFLEGDIRKLKDILKNILQPFDVVVNAWTSIGYFSREEDLDVFRQARELSREGAILFLAETMHSQYIALKFVPTSYAEIDNMVLLENRKYDPTTSEMNTTWSFYVKDGENLRFMDKVEWSTHVYSLSEISAILRRAGWEIEAYYGSFSTLQPFNPLTSLNIVAKAK